MVTKHMYSTYIYNSLLVNVSVSLIVSEVLPHMTKANNTFIRSSGGDRVNISHAPQISGTADQISAVYTQQ